MLVICTFHLHHRKAFRPSRKCQSELSPSVNMPPCLMFMPCRMYVCCSYYINNFIFGFLYLPLPRPESEPPANGFDTRVSSILYFCLCISNFGSSFVFRVIFAFRQKFFVPLLCSPAPLTYSSVVLAISVHFIKVLRCDAICGELVHHLSHGRCVLRSESACVLLCVTIHICCMEGCLRVVACEILFITLKY